MSLRVSRLTLPCVSTLISPLPQILPLLVTVSIAAGALTYQARAQQATPVLHDAMSRRASLHSADPKLGAAPVLLDAMTT